MRKFVKDSNGNAIDFDAAVELMDDELREAIHEELAPCTDQEFYDAYVKAHYEKYDEIFEVN